VAKRRWYQAVRGRRLDSVKKKYLSERKKMKKRRSSREEEMAGISYRKA